MGALRQNRRRMDMKPALTALVLLALCGCCTSKRSASVQPSAPSELSEDFRRADHEAFSTRERELIAAAWLGIRQSGKLPTGGSEDAYYRVRHTSDGHEVFVLYVTDYDGNRPVLEPCVHNQVLLSHEGKVMSVLSGPECWP